MQSMRSLFSRLLYKEERECLVFGYIRQQFRLLYIPSDIIKLCLSLYDDVCYWQIKDNKYDEFISYGFAKAINGPIFKIRNVEFQLYSFPNGEYLGELGYIQLYLTVLKYPRQMKALHIYFVLYCQQTQNEFRRAKIFNFKIVSSGTGTVKHEHVEYAHAWAAHCAPLKDCQHLKSKTITFGAMVDIMHIEYHCHDNKLFKNYATPIVANIKSEYEWSLNEKQIEKLKLLDYEQFVCSDRFGNNCWRLGCMPNGQKNEERGNLSLGLVLYKMAFGLNCIKVNYTLTCKETGTVWTDTKNYIINVKWTSWPNGLFATEQLTKHKALTFTVKLEVVGLISSELGTVARKEWHKYGFVDS